MSFFLAANIVYAVVAGVVALYPLEIYNKGRSLIQVLMVSCVAQRLLLIYDFRIPSYDYVAGISLLIGLSVGVILACVWKTASLATSTVVSLSLVFYFDLPWAASLSIAFGAGFAISLLANAIPSIPYSVVHIGVTLSVSILLVTDVVWLAGDRNEREWAHYPDNLTEWLSILAVVLARVFLLFVYARRGFFKK